MVGAYQNASQRPPAARPMGPDAADVGRPGLGELSSAGPRAGRCYPRRPVAAELGRALGAGPCQREPNVIGASGALGTAADASPTTQPESSQQSGVAHWSLRSSSRPAWASAWRRSPTAGPRPSSMSMAGRCSTGPSPRCKGAGFREVIVVTGHAAERIRPFLAAPPDGMTLVERWNPDYADGQQHRLHPGRGRRRGGRLRAAQLRHRLRRLHPARCGRPGRRQLAGRRWRRAARPRGDEGHPRRPMATWPGSASSSIRRRPSASTSASVASMPPGRPR